MATATLTRSREPRIHAWTKDEYYRMAVVGLFDGVHVELIEGQVIEMSPMLSQHATRVLLCAQALETVFGADHHQRIQMVIDAGEDSEPQPDVAIVSGSIRDYSNAHPTTAALIVEVADTSLRYDRTEKASLYARLGIRDYWILNLKDRQLEVLREPVREAAQPFGYGYRRKQVFKRRESVVPLALPAAKIKVADLLP